MGHRRGEARASRGHLPGRGLHAAEGHAPAGQAGLHAVLHLLHLAQHQGGTDRVLHRALAGPGHASTSARTSGPTRRTSCTPRCRPAKRRSSRRAWCWPPRWRPTTACTGRPTSCSSTCRAARRARNTSTPRSTSCAPGTGTPGRRACAPSSRASTRSVAPTRRCRPTTACASCDIDNDQLIAYMKASPDGANVVVTVVNLDPHNTQIGWLAARPARHRRAAPTSPSRCTTC